jgi:hypothetical protein
MKALKHEGAPSEAPLPTSGSTSCHLEERPFVLDGDERSLRTVLGPVSFERQSASERVDRRRAAR